MSQMIGITERGDAGIHLEWKDELTILPMAVLITKNPTDRFIEEVLKVKEKVIIHLTVTGFGGSIIEPGVPKPEVVRDQVRKLISQGFPVEQLVLRVDPVIPTRKGLGTAGKVLSMFSTMGIKRCRVSILDMYPHVRARFEAAGIEPPYTSFQAPANMKEDMKQFLKRWENLYNFETCAEDLGKEYKRACVSQTDADLLGVDISFYGRKNNRTGCMCPQNKHEMLDHPHQCAHKCLYCYWQ